MPKGRMLNKKISRSEKVATLSVHAALLFSWSIPHLDIEGRIYADAVSLKGIVVPRLEYMTLEIIIQCVQEICASGLAMLYGEGRYLQFMGFHDNQRLDRNREAASEIPAPTPEELQSNSRGAPDTSKVKLSKVKLSKVNNAKAGEKLPVICEQPVDKEVSEALKKVYASGLNIYGLFNKTKRELKTNKDFMFPREVILGVCNQYWKDKPKIKDSWPWFMRVLKAETQEWYANQAQKEKADLSKIGMAQNVKEVLAGMLKGPLKL